MMYVKVQRQADTIMVLERHKGREMLPAVRSSASHVAPCAMELAT
jgi:hypothetical protein